MADRLISACVVRIALAATSVALLACAGNAPAHVETNAVPPGAVAACAGAAFSAETVASVAFRRGLSPRAAVDELAGEARLARRALDLGLGKSPGVVAALHGADARAILLAIKANASRTEPTAEELANIRAERWAELDRPELVRVVHAIVIVKAADPQREAARALAVAIAAATRGAATTQEFLERAKSVPHEGFDVRVEELEPVAKDGRVLNGTQFDPSFTAAAHQLAAPHDQVGPVASEFGFHVIHLVERLPPKRIPDRDLVAAVRGEVFSLRAYTASKRLVDDLRKATPVLVERSVDELFRHLDPPPPPPR